jgi:hypothetical protein
MYRGVGVIFIFVCLAFSFTPLIRVTSDGAPDAVNTVEPETAQIDVGEAIAV